MIGHRLPHVGKRLAATGRVSANIGAETEHGNVLSRVVCSRPGRVAAMISRHDREIARAHGGFELGNPSVELFESRSVAGHVPPVAEKRIEIHEVGKYQSPVGDFRERRKSRIEQGVVTLPFQILRDTPVCEDIADFANPHHLATGVAQPVEQGRLRRRGSHSLCDWRYVRTRRAGGRGKVGR